MIIRAAEMRDAREISEVHVRSWQAAYVGIVPDEDLVALSVERREQYWRQILSRNERSTLVLVNGHLIVGVSCFGPARDEDCDSAMVAELYALYLVPEHWTKGYGLLLYRATETRIRQNLIENLVLWVFEKNTRARKFYESIGFRLELEKRKEMRFALGAAMEIRYRKFLKEEIERDGETKYP
jgi:GNAT superfamily N-acetyltransferase